MPTERSVVDVLTIDGGFLTFFSARRRGVAFRIVLPAQHDRVTPVGGSVANMPIVSCQRDFPSFSTIGISSVSSSSIWALFICAAAGMSPNMSPPDIRRAGGETGPTRSELCRQDHTSVSGSLRRGRQRASRACTSISGTRAFAYSGQIGSLEPPAIERRGGFRPFSAPELADCHRRLTLPAWGSAGSAHRATLPLASAINFSRNGDLFPPMNRSNDVQKSLAPPPIAHEHRRKDNCHGDLPM